MCVLTWGRGASAVNTFTGLWGASAHYGVVQPGEPAYSPHVFFFLTYWVILYIVWDSLPPVFHPQ